MVIENGTVFAIFLMSDYRQKYKKQANDR